MATEGELQFIKLLNLRKVLRKERNFNGNKLMAKFGIGVVKYEICSNFLRTPLLQFTLNNTSTILHFSVKNKAKKIVAAVTARFEPEHRALQIKGQIIITGGEKCPYRLTIANKQQVFEYDSEQK